MNNSPANFENGGYPSFSWSLRRRRLYEFCRRAYYFHYYGAVGGWDTTADDHVRLIYRLKHLCGVEEWLMRILTEAVRAVFIRRRPQVRDNLVFMSALLRQECSRRFRRGWNEAMAEQWRQDPKCINLTELYYANTAANRKELFFYSQQRLETILTDFAGHPLAEVLSDLDSASFRHFPVPLDLAVGDLEVWLAPTLIWQAGETLTVLEIVSSGIILPRETGMAAALHRQLASHRFHFPPEKIVSCFYLPGTGATAPELQEPQPLSVADMVQALNESASPMLERIRPDGSADPADFPGWYLAQSELCRPCRFRALCLGPESLRLSS